MKIISVEAIVVGVTPYKENSRIINIFTKDHGIIGCYSKGCKNIKSKLRLISERFAYAKFQISYKDKGLSILLEGDIINYFDNIKNDIIKLSYLTYICDLSTKVYKECEDSEVYDLMMSAINKIEADFNPKIITNILELQYLNYIGIKLNLDECVCCGSSKVVTLSLERGGYVCAKCLKNEPIISEKVIKLLRLYNYVDISKINNLEIDEDVSNKINIIIDEYYDRYSGISTKSKKFLKEIDS